ncbi:UDP-glycosyltransferase 73D1-like protein [Sesbania bispinosa]|nr:UDP-glycosyltransferase 73D1-like protein [Sesbania bispinosa]
MGSPSPLSSHPLMQPGSTRSLIKQKPQTSKIQFQVLPFPCLEAGLPEGCENVDTVPSPEYQHLFYDASNMLQEPLEKWLLELESIPSCIISDICLPWTLNVATKFNIPRVVLHLVSCFTLLCSHNLIHSKVHERVTSMSEPFVVPNLPDTLEFTRAQLPEGMKQDPEDWKQGILVNTFEELESMYVRGYEKVARRIWCIGPLSLHDKLMLEKFGIDDKASMDEPECLNFLNSNKPCSVIYENDCSAELDKWLKEENFEERNKGRGLIIRGWAPQVQILSHPATGGFLSHCVDVKVLKIGLRIGVESVVSEMETQKGEEVLVKMEDVKKAIEQLMEQGGEGEQRRNRAREMKEMAHKGC